MLIFCITFARSLRVKSITVSLLLSSNSAGLSNPLLSESFGDTLTIATTKGMEAATEERLFGIVQQFFQGLMSDKTRKAEHNLYVCS